MQQKRQDDEQRFHEELAGLQQSLAEKTRSEKDLQREMSTIKRKMGQTLADTNEALGFNQTSAKKMEKELWSVKAEKNRFEEVIQKLQDTVLLGTRAEALVEDMKKCSRTIAMTEADKEGLLAEVEDLEQKLANVNAETKDHGTDNSAKITAIQRVKNLRSELHIKEEKIRDLDERLCMEVDRMQSLGQELKISHHF